MSMITSALLLQQGWLKFNTELPEAIRICVEEKNFTQLDQLISLELNPSGALYQKLSSLMAIQNIEFILTLRQSPDDEDGIWHDDGSRQLAFSLGLNPDVQHITGGELELRQYSKHTALRFSPLAWGEVLVFLTGNHGWEHRVLAVQHGLRLHAAGWIN